jgi:serine/threonine-protein kinase
LLPEDVEKIIPNCQIVGQPMQGGQKLVFPALVDGNKCALKFLKIENLSPEEMPTEVYKRCKREVDTLIMCQSPYLIKIGSHNLSQVSYNGDDLLYYSENWINGEDLRQILLRTKAPFKNNTIANIAQDISYAIEELWNHHKIHRDIKPQNIMYDEDNKNFILLDMGMLYDSSLESLTRYGYLPGTLGYYSPEQFDLSRKSELDFRSDLFVLGIVLYELATLIHPYKNDALDSDTVLRNIVNLTPKKPHEINSSISLETSNLIMRLLKKRPSERYRNFDKFRTEISYCIKKV